MKNQKSFLVTTNCYKARFFEIITDEQNNVHAREIEKMDYEDQPTEQQGFFKSGGVHRNFSYATPPINIQAKKRKNMKQFVSQIKQRIKKIAAGRRYKYIGIIMPEHEQSLFSPITKQLKKMNPTKHLEDYGNVVDANKHELKERWINMNKIVTI